jgi:type IV pilus assembly protein PilE
VALAKKTLDFTVFRPVCVDRRSQARTKPRIVSILSVILQGNASLGVYTEQHIPVSIHASEVMMQQVQGPIRALRRARGVTLIELMVVVAIVGILAAVAYPAYANYILRGNRGAAQSYMLDLALAESQMLVDTRGYVAKADLTVDAPTRVTNNYTVDIVFSNTAPQTFKITATPKGKQVADGALTIDQAGAKTPSDKW